MIVRPSPAMAHAAKVAHARSCARFAQQWAQQEARSASGLVSVSTTCKGLPVVVAMAQNTIEIDKQQARVTRLRKSLGVAAKQLHNLGSKRQKVWMLTLTYAGDNSAWRPEHISRYLDALRKWHYAATGCKKVRYAWVAELQQRGVIHYHVIVWLEHGLTPPKGDRPWKTTDRKGLTSWHPPMWPHGMTNRLKSTAPVAYLMKYASKIESKNVGSFPHGARIHGCGGLDPAGRSIRRWVLWPAYVQGNASVSDRFRPAPGGGFINAETGELLLSEYAPTGGGFERFIRILNTPRKVEAAGPFSWNPHYTDSANGGQAGYVH